MTFLFASDTESVESSSVRLWIYTHNAPYMKRVVAAVRAELSRDIKLTTDPNDIQREDYFYELVPKIRHWPPLQNQLGANPYSRLQFVELMEEHGLHVVPWCKMQDWQSAFDLWQTDKVVLKASYSSQGQNVEVVQRGQIPSVDLIDDRGVCMKFTQTQKVLKVYFFHGVIVGAYVWDLPSLENSNFADIVKQAVEEADLAKAVALQKRFENSLHPIIKYAKRELYGWSSIDFMEYDGHWSAIELNNGRVGMGMITRLVPGWEARFTEALTNYCRDVYKAFDAGQIQQFTPRGLWERAELS